jgi:hypothetical protein
VVVAGGPGEKALSEHKKQYLRRRYEIELCVLEI